MATRTATRKTPSIFLARVIRDLPIGEIATAADAPIRAAHGTFRGPLTLHAGQVVDVARAEQPGRWIVALPGGRGQVLTLTTAAACGLLETCRTRHDGRPMASGIEGQMAIGLYTDARLIAKLDGREPCGRIA